MELFGFELKKVKAQNPLEAFQIDKEDVAADAMVISDGGMSVFSYDSTSVPTDEIELITTYRSISLSSEVDEALQEIRNEVFIFDVPGKRAFDIDFKDEPTAPSKPIRKKIAEEFIALYNMVDFDNRGMAYFDDWYINSKLYLHKIIDNKQPKMGIQKVVSIDPLRIRRVKFLPKSDNNGVYDMTKIQQWYIYSNSFGKSIAPGTITAIEYGSDVAGLKIKPDAMCYTDSGLIDRQTGKTVGYLNKVIVPYNNLRMMEDAMLIFRVVRAPQRRVIYIDVAGMQKNKAEQYMKDMMSRFKNKMVYDSKTGQLADRRNVMSMLEDYWLPRRDGGKGTEIDTLDGQSSQDILEEVEYYRDKFWRALNVPRSRFGQDDAPSFPFGKGIEIQRDEYRFRKFLDKIRVRFLLFMKDLLKTQLILKNIITPDDWDAINKSIVWKFTEDNAFVEYKESEILNNRLVTLNQMQPFIGKFFSQEWIKKNVLRQTDKEIEDMDAQMAAEPPWDMGFDDPLGANGGAANGDGGDEGGDDKPAPKDKPAAKGKAKPFADTGTDDD
jgi:hypothetical protein